MTPACGGVGRRQVNDHVAIFRAGSKRVVVQLEVGGSGAQGLQEPVDFMPDLRRQQLAWLIFKPSDIILYKLIACRR